MKQFLVVLVFTLGKEYRVRHRVLCVVVLYFGSSDTKLALDIIKMNEATGPDGRRVPDT